MRGWGSSKYGNKITITSDGQKFHSKKEAKDWEELKILERAGAISCLRRQVKIPITSHGEPICNYIADFTYIVNGDSKITIHETKGVWTQTARLKWKLLKAQLGDTVIYKVT